MTREPLPPIVVEALNEGNKIEAIKRLRAITDLGLKEAKDWIDSYERGATAPLPQLDKPAARNATDARFAHHHAAQARSGLAPGEVPRGGGAGKWLALLALVVLAFLAALYRR